MFKKKVSLSIQELEREFDLRALHIGNLNFQKRQIETSINRVLNEMEQLEKKGKELRAKVKQEVVNKISQGEEKTETPNEIH